MKVEKNTRYICGPYGISNSNLLTPEFLILVLPEISWSKEYYVLIVVIDSIVPNALSPKNKLGAPYAIDNGSFHHNNARYSLLQLNRE